MTKKTNNSSKIRKKVPQMTKRLYKLYKIFYSISPEYFIDNLCTMN